MQRVCLQRHLATTGSTTVRTLHTLAAAPPAAHVLLSRRRARCSHPAARFVPAPLHCLHTMAMHRAPQQQTHVEAAAATSDLPLESTHLPPAPDVDLAPAEVEADAPAQHISAANLRAYFDVLPPDARPAAEPSSEPNFTWPPPEEAFVVEHAPLRTQLKSDATFALPVIDRQHQMRTMPFSMDAFRQLLHGKFACEIAADRRREREIAAAAAAASVAASIPAAAVPASPTPLSLTAHSSVHSDPARPMLIDRRLAPARKRGAPAAKAQDAAAAAASVPQAPAVASSATPPSAQPDQLDSDASPAVQRLRSLLSSPGPFLGALRSLQQSGDHAAVSQACRELLEPLATQAISRLDGFIAQRAPGAVVEDSSATAALAFVHSLQNPPFLDTSLSLCINSSLQQDDTKQAKRVFASLMKLQQRQHECFELYLWDLGMQIMHEAHGTHASVSLPNAVPAPEPVDPNAAFPLALSDATSSTSALAKQILHASKPFNPFLATPYIKFIEALTKKEGAQRNDALVTAGAHAAAQVSSSSAPSTHPCRRRMRRSAPRCTSLDLPPLPVSPNVKPALQLFNRLLEQPTRASLALPSQSLDGSGGDSVETAARINTKTNFQFSWARLTKSMLGGVVEVATGDLRALQHKYAPILKAAEQAERKGFVRSGAGQHPSAEWMEFDSLSDAEMLRCLEEFAAKKKDALELLSGLSMHILQSFVRNVVPKDATAPSAAAGATAMPKTSAASSARVESKSAVSATASPSTAPSVPMPTTSYSSDNMNWKQWRLIKLLLCHASGPANDVSSSSAAATAPQNYRPSSWRNRSLHALNSGEVRDQRNEVRKQLLNLFPGLVTPDVIDGIVYHLTPALQREVFHTLERLKQNHLNLTHLVLESYIQLCTAIAPIEARIEALRTGVEIKLARRGRHLSELLESSKHASDKEVVARKEEHESSVARLHATPLLPSPIRSVETLLRYMDRELIMPNAHTFTLLFHKALFGGGLRTGVRYASSHGSGGANSHGRMDSSQQVPTVRPSGGDAGSEASDLRMLQSMLHSASAAFRRSPAAIAGASKDFISSLLIQVVLPKSVSMYTPARVRRGRKKHRSAPHQPHSKLLEAFSSAVLNVLDKQRRRMAKEDNILKLAGTHPSQVRVTPDDEYPAPPTTPQTSPNTLPFQLVQDQSGLLNSVLGALEHVHSNPERRIVRTHIQSVLARGTGVRPLPGLYSRRLLAARSGIVSNHIVTNMLPPRDISYSDVQRVRIGLVQSAAHRFGHQRRMADLQAAWRERDKQVFGRFNRPSTYQTGDLTRNASVSLVQLPSYVVPVNVYHNLLRYYAHTNNLAAALVCYDRMQHVHVSPSFPAALALVQLAAKYMNYDALAHFVAREALPLSRHSPTRRALIWRELITGFARFNTYSNIDTYMRFMHDLLVRVLPDTHTGINNKRGSFKPAEPDAIQRKEALDRVWQAWTTRGGAIEVLSVWDVIREKCRAAGGDDSTALAYPAGVSIDSDSVDAFLSGVLHQSSGGDAMGSLSGDDAAAACAALLRHLANHGQPLTPEQQSRLSVDLPIFIAARRLEDQPSDIASSHSDASQRALQRDSFASDRSWNQFCADFNIPSATLIRTDTEASQSDVSTTEERWRTLDAATTLNSAALLSPPSKHPSPTEPLATRTGVRAAVLAQRLRSFNAYIGSAGIAHALNRLEQLSGGQAVSKSTQQQAS